MSPQSSPKQPFKLPGLGSGNSIMLRIGVAAAGLIVLLIVFAIIKSLIFKGPDLASYVTIAQDQQELLHLAGDALSSQQQSALSEGSQNLSATIQAALASNQTQIITYLATNHQKINAKTLNLKVSTILDTQLTTAQSAGIYDPTFQGIMQAQLKAYMNDLQRTYQASNGKKGRALLSSDYKQASLLLNQLVAVPN